VVNILNAKFKPSGRPWVGDSVLASFFLPTWVDPTGSRRERRVMFVFVSQTRW
jgi:hypothetical protein